MTRTIDIFGVRPDRTAEVVRQLREAQNVLSSYTDALDLLAEALQNATDAIDARSADEPDAPRRLVIDFDVPAGSFTVTDTGTGMGEKSLEVVLTPNVSLKSGGLAGVRGGRWRGEKGVGLSFLMLASNRLSISTCNAKRRLDLSVEDANLWVSSEGRDSSVPKGTLSNPKPPDRRCDSSSYTSVTVAGIDAGQFDRDVFDLDLGALVWELRTRTAVGNTAALFSPLGRQAPDPIEIVLNYRGEGQDEWEAPFIVPYAYATPEDLLEGYHGLEDIEVLDLEEVRGLRAGEMARRTQGRAVRHTRRLESKSGHAIDAYVLAIDGRVMASRLTEIDSAGYWGPPEWQGFWVATRDMPTGVALRSGLISPRTYERRVFILLQYDGLTLDLGRKTLAGRTRGMLNDVVERLWEEDLRSVVPRIGRTDRTPARTTVTALRAQVRRAQALPDLAIDVPYLKHPDKAAGVMALFHELLAAGEGPRADLRPLTSGVFHQSGGDALVYVGQPNGEGPLHVVFALEASELLAVLERDERSAATVALAVVWSLGARALEEVGVDVEELDAAADGATHELALHGLANRDSLRVLELERLITVA